MKTTMIKAAFILSMLGSGGAIALASGKGESTDFSPKTFLKNDETVDEKPQTFFNWIQKEVRCPEFVNSDDDHRVELWLDIDANNNIVVLNAKSNSKRLSDFVIKELHGRPYPTADVSGVRHFAINFKRLG